MAHGSSCWTQADEWGSLGASMAQRAPASALPPPTRPGGQPMCGEPCWWGGLRTREDFLEWETWISWQAEAATGHV